MKITKLVILFNYKKILLGIIVSLILMITSFQISSNTASIVLKILSILILLNIIASVVASYILYDHSDLYELNDLQEIIDFRNTESVILIHASFDPLSGPLGKKYKNLDLVVCDIYGNRHEHEKGIEISKKVFPPNPAEIKISPNKLPFEDKSVDVILAVTSLHEILNHKDRVLFFKEAKRIVKDNGVIVMSEQFQNIINFIFFNIGAFHFLTKKQWEKAISEAGLKVVVNKKNTPFANTLIIR
ncbi:methyltransferase domain-containing protein [Elizabethkingia bruuniana]|uniref:methyltransferase domain-containing protein n=1 Tax=Elizabethkingia bruuniana TaxID=1756149 RepID=UPI00241FAFFB|nr:methyltransferase domain-containing protein [Elizabethkingia bruuniana]